MTTVVIGVGNPFRRDDGVGPAVIELLRERLTGLRSAGGLTGVRFVTSDGETTALIDAWTGADRAVVVDAVRVAAGDPGRIHRFSAEHPAATRAGVGTPHAADLGDAVALARALDRMPRSLLIFGVQVDDIGFGPGLSAAVAAAARHLADEIATLLVG